MRSLLSIFFSVLVFSSYSQSKMKVDTLCSNFLTEKRLVTVYLPNDYTVDSVYSVLYTTDGQLFTVNFQHIIDSLIAIKAINPLIVIASHSNETWLPAEGSELRNFDYVEGKIGAAEYRTRFDKHFNFFTQELISYAETNYSVSNLKENRMFYGISNGADFGVSLALKRSDLFSKFILFSVFQGSTQPFLWTNSDNLHFIVGYGKMEDKHVKDEVVRMKKYFKKHKVEYSILKWNGGHDRKMWESTFVNALSLINWE